MAKKYREETEQKYELLLRKLTNTFPNYCKEYFNYLRLNNEIRTCYAYATDLHTFFQYLKLQNTVFGAVEIKDYTLESLSLLKALDIQEYMTYLSNYTDESGTTYTNGDSAKNRKLIALRSFFGYFCDNEFIDRNPVRGVKIKKPAEKNVIALDKDEITSLLEYLEHLENKLKFDAELNSKNRAFTQKLAYFQKTKYRDVAILLVFLGTGIRVSECVGLDITDVNFKENSLNIIRKGGKGENVYFNDKVAQALKEYIELERPQFVKKAENENILFYSTRGTRLGVRAVEKLVKKYITEALPMRSGEVSVHKLRSTFATTAYRETEDIYAISKALGHSSLKMVSKYAKAGDKDKKRISDSIRF